MKKDSAKERINIRLTKKQKNRIKALAEIYCDGNISAWIAYSAINAPRKFLLEKEKGTDSKKNRSRKTPTK